MLPELARRSACWGRGFAARGRGEDVVVGVVETHGRKGTAELAERLERVPLRDVEYKGTLFSEMDVDQILARKPEIVLIDELAHTNVEGSRFAKRYEDVLLLLENKIDVLSTINIQHIESLAPRVQALTGISVREQVPDWVLDRADEIVISDLTPEALVTRMRRGDIYPAERVERSLANFFRRGNLIALREMALQRVTRAVDRTLDDYVKRKKLGSHWTVAEKVAVCINSGPQARDLIARGARLAEALNAELYVLHVSREQDTDEKCRRTLEASLQLAKNLGAQIVNLTGSDTARDDGDLHPGATSDAGDCRPVRNARVAFVSLLPGFAEVHGRGASCRFTYRDAGETVKRILVVDDDRQITRMLRTSLQSSGYRVLVANSGSEGVESFKKERPDLVITDLVMPGMDGVELTRALRRVASTPIIVLSVNNAESMKVTALDEGADDYLTKPFSMPELLARVRAQLRKVVDSEAPAARVEVGPFVLDTVAHTVVLNGKELYLTPKEFELLELLLRNADSVMTHKVLLRAIWGPAGEGAARVSARPGGSTAEEAGPGGGGSVHPERALDWLQAAC